MSVFLLQKLHDGLRQGESQQFRVHFADKSQLPCAEIKANLETLGIKSLSGGWKGQTRKDSSQDYDAWEGQYNQIFRWNELNELFWGETLKQRDSEAQIIFRQTDQPCVQAQKCPWALGRRNLDALWLHSEDAGHHVHSLHEYGRGDWHLGQSLRHHHRHE